jgi:spore coat protein CotH
VSSFLRLRLVVAVLLAWGGSQSASAQTADDLFNPDTLHRVELWLNSQDWDKLKQNFQENTYYPADLTWNGVTARNIGIRSRGGGSRSGTKPGLRLDADRYATEQTFLGLKSFVLDNLTQDASGVKETVTMRLFARLGVPAPREAHTRLYVNGEYIGLYAIVESIDKDLLARLYGTLDGNIQNDGYLFEYEWGDAWYFGNLGANLEPYKAKFDPQTNENRSDSEKWGPIAELVRVVNETAIERFEEVVGPMLDLRAFIRYVAAQNFVAENDGFLGYAGVNNFYFYRLEDRQTHVFISWDEDNGFVSTDFGLAMRHDENVLMRRALEVASLRQYYYQTLADAANSAAEGSPASAPWLEREIRRQLDLIAEAMREDSAKPYSNGDHDAARASMLAFTSARISYVRCEVARQTGQPLPAGCS